MGGECELLVATIGYCASSSNRFANYCKTFIDVKLASGDALANRYSLGLLAASGRPVSLNAKSGDLAPDLPKFRND